MQATPPAPTILAETVRRALSEDIDRGDITTEACVEPTAVAVATLNARERVVVCGLPVLEEVFAQIDLMVDVDVHVQDGDIVEAGASVAALSGPATSILLGERVALNFLQRLTGVATMTRLFADALPEGSSTRITDTRKTTPGLRAFERYAVRCGGGYNHREDLGAAILIKDNHIAAAGGCTQAIERARAYAPHTCRIECEVDTLAQLEEVLTAKADIVMLDNFTDEEVRDALALINGRAIVEVSGGITLERVAALGTLGVDVISVGALTHSSPSSDLGLDWG
ncbi:MAG: carboxylating nicotinate-nucleotide diphosphorylase [Deltaproteobacteria bacterium]|nr:carboxylating nicotinate-nucleotide diphosphorylase [Deltaproteobacteria bacterium]MBW2718504.1 carboxylating nicotinate-nucleotide diphosphorylase [Deltaproteobacteria bacterium]